ncbi:MAG: glycosyltransferase family 2 protein [Patescibacteria group bacterium]|nr:glycosyltransferase family 2 protein [Patescibacteria group bacterium]
MKKISIIIPVYNEEQNIPLLFDKLRSIKAKLNNYALEIIFINDGSKDNSEKAIREIGQTDNCVKLINFSRNFGHQQAISAGIDYSAGDAVITIDSDLQDPPEICLELIAGWEKGNEIVYAKRRSRKDSFLKKLTAHLFYRMLNKITYLNIAVDTGDFRLMDRKVVEALKKCPEKNRFLRGLSSYVGFQTSFVLYDREKRLHGKSNYSVKRMIKLAMDGVLGFSDFLPKLILISGSVIALLGFLGLAAVLIGKLFSPDFPFFYSRLIVAALFFIGGLQIIFLGVIGEYASRIYTEVQNRPFYIVKDLVNFENSGSGGLLI